MSALTIGSVTRYCPPSPVPHCPVLTPHWAQLPSHPLLHRQRHHDAKWHGWFNIIMICSNSQIFTSRRHLKIFPKTFQFLRVFSSRLCKFPISTWTPDWTTVTPLLLLWLSRGTFTQITRHGCCVPELVNKRLYCVEAHFQSVPGPRNCTVLNHEKECLH